jgi:cullin-4
VEKNGKTLNGEITPDRKRPKHPPSSPMKYSPQPLSKMYSFSSQQPNGKIIDLTGSPASPPRRQQKVMNYSAAPKKLVVKNLRTVPRTDPAQFFEQQWEKLSKALDIIFSGGEILPYSYEQLYQSVQNVCKQGRAELLEGRFRDSATEAISEKAAELSSFAATRTSYVQTLGKVEEAWENWNKQFVSTYHLLVCIQIY